MLVPYSDFARHADAVRRQIAEACNLVRRNPADVELMAITKTQPPAAAEYAARYGLRAVGENRVQEGAEKRSLCQAVIAWELVGHLQSNKAKLAVEAFDRVQSVDSDKLIDRLDRAAAELEKTLPILLQINAGFDPAKHGVDPADAPRLLETALAKKNLRVDGLMTIAPLSPDPDVARQTFENLRAIRDQLASQFATPLRELSMGMSGDLTAAVKAGATLVRIGTALFGARI